MANNTITIDDYITEEMNLVNGSLIYPVLTVFGDHMYGSKEIYLDNIYDINDEERDS